MTRRLWAVGGVVLLLAAGLAVAVRGQAPGLSPLWTAAALLAIVCAMGAVWLGLGRRPAGRRRLSRTFWIGLVLLLVGLVASQQWYAVTTIRGPITLSTAQPAIAPLTPMRRAKLPPALGQMLRRAFPRLAVGQAWQVIDQPGAYEIWLKRPRAGTYALQVLWGGQELQVENQRVNALYAEGSGPELPIGRLRSIYRGGRGVLGPYVFPGYLLYVAPRAGESWTVDLYTGGLSEGVSE